MGRLLRGGVAVVLLLACGVLRAQNTAIATFKTFPQDVYYDMTTGYYAPPLLGRATTSYLNTGSEMVEFFLQDDTGGIRVRGAADGTFASSITNEPANITGTLVEVDYLVRLVSEDGELIAELRRPRNSLSLKALATVPPLPAPLPATLGEIHAGAFDGQLVVVSNVFASSAYQWPPNQDNQAWSVTNAAGSLTIYVDKETELDGQTAPAPGTAFHVVGVVDVGSQDTPDVRMLMPRTIADFDVPVIPNEPPAVIAPDRVVGAPGVAVTFNVQGSDANLADVLAFSVSNAPPSATFSALGPRTYAFAWTPGPGDEGEYAVTFWVEDGEFAAFATTTLDIRSLSGGPDHPWINEFHYDNVGTTDVGEGIELAGKAGIALSDYAIYTYTNAAPGAPAYLHAGPIVSSNTIPDETGNGYGAAWIARSLPNGGRDLAPATAGFALVHTVPTNRVLQFLSYEGTFTATNGPAAGLTSYDVAVAESPSSPVGLSLYLIGNASVPDAVYESFFWYGPGLATPGRINAGQAFGGLGGQAVVWLGSPATVPSLPGPGDAFHVSVAYDKTYTASMSGATLYYSLDGWVTSNAVAMTTGTESSGTLQTQATVPGQPLGTTVSFYVRVDYTGNQSASPAISPTATLTIRKAIVFQGFEGTANDTWLYTPMPGGGSILVVSDPKAEGAKSLRVSGPAVGTEPPAVDFHNQFLDGYTNVVFSIAYAAYGVDTDDRLVLSLSYDGGDTWATNVVLASGYNGWSFDFGTVYPLQPGTARPFTADSNPYVHPIPAGVTQVKARVRHVGPTGSGNTGDYYYLDAVSLTAESGTLVNLPPAFDPVATNWVAEATRTNVFQIAAYDPNGGAVGLTLQSVLPPGASFSTAVVGSRTVGTFTFEPPLNTVSNVYALQFAATDADGTTAKQVTATVVEPFTGFFWGFDDGTYQGWRQLSHNSSPYPLWDWSVYPDENANPLSSGPTTGSNSTHYAGINAYSNSDPQAVDLWWVGPVVDCSHMATPRLTFAAWFQYDGPDLELYATTNTASSVSPDTWDRIPVPLPTAPAAWTSCETSLEGWTNRPFRLAFRYTADGTSGGSKCWAVDSIKIDDDTTEPPPPPPPPASTRLIISEYGEGSSFNKYIEIFNLSSDTVDLADYTLKKEINGAGGYAQSLALSGALAAYSAYVVVHSSASPELLGMADLSTGSSVLDFNGNDAVALFHTNAIADAVGPLGVTSDWGKDCRLVRKPNVTLPRTVYDPNEWVRTAGEDWSNVGVHAVDGLPTPPAMPTGLAVSDVAVDGFTLSWNAVAGADGYLVDVATNAAFTPLVAGYAGFAVAGTTTPVTGLLPETAYWARVRAVSNAVAGANSAAVSTTTLSAPLMLSEYGEGGANNNMYVEIHNPHAVPVSLAGYAIRKKTSTLTDYGTPLNLSGTLSPGATYVVAHAASAEALRALADLVTDADAMNFNGRHAVALFHDGGLVDVVGWPSVAWGVDKTFVRDPDIDTPNATYTPDEWIELAADDWSNVGIVADPAAPPAPPSRVPVVGAVTVGAGGVVVTFSVPPTREDGVAYALQRAATPGAASNDWTTLVAPLVPQDAAVGTFTDPAPPSSNAFYRVKATR